MVRAEVYMRVFSWVERVVFIDRGVGKRGWPIYIRASSSDGEYPESVEDIFAVPAVSVLWG